MNSIRNKILTMEKAAQEALGRGGYRVVGNHSAVRVCHWTRNSLFGKGVCFKEKWYDGFESHRCMQMTPAAVYCTQQCRFCWCPQPADVTGEDWRSFPFPTEATDDPEDILAGCLDERRSSLETLAGRPEVAMKRFEGALMPTHIGVCLSGEPALYPKISGILEEAHRMGMTSHMVTNGTMPERLESMDTLPSHLFVSLYAPDGDTYLKTCRPFASDAWEKVNRTLQLLPSLQCESTVELTLVGGLNMTGAADYAKLIEIANPSSVDVKAFQRTGGSIVRTPAEAAPEWQEVVAFAKEVGLKAGYSIKDEFAPYAVLLTRT